MDMFTEETTAAIIVGKRGGATIEAIRSALPLLGELSEKAGVTLEITGHGDFATDEPNDEQRTDFAVGVVIAEADTYGPATFSPASVDDALNHLGKLSDDDWASLSDVGLEMSDDTDLAPWLICFGPLANGWVALGYSDETDDLEEIRGSGMDQSEQEEAVWGHRVLTTSYEEYPRSLDLSSAAQSEHMNALANDGTGAQYFLIASYD